MYQAIHFCVRGIDFASLCDLDIIFCNCSDSLAVFVFHFIITKKCSRNILTDSEIKQINSDIYTLTNIPNISCKSVLA